MLGLAIPVVWILSYDLLTPTHCNITILLERFPVEMDEKTISELMREIQFQDTLELAGYGCIG